MKIYKPYTVRYYVGIRKRQKGILESGEKFYIIKNPKHGWCADPFLFESNEKTYVFAERWDYCKQKGCIAYVEVKKGVIFYPWKVVIEEQYHLSYPNIWKDDEGIHICVESSENKEIYTYTAVCFPDVWRKDKVWWRGSSFADTTILFNERNMPNWLFTYGCSELVKGKLFRLKVNGKCEVEGGLHFVSRDAKIARPAGKFIHHKGKQYRIAQNCSESYGRSLSVCEVIECTEQCYKEIILFERTSDCVKTNKRLNTIGMHTYNHSNQYEVVDFRVRKLSFIDMFYYYLKKYATK